MKRLSLGLLLISLGGCGDEGDIGLPVTPDVRRFPLRALEQSEVPPPAIQGGTLLVTRGGELAVASDPDHDTVFVVDLRAFSVSARLELQDGSEPGRVVEGPADSFFVSLRGARSVLRMTPEGTEVYRQTVCVSPEGLAYNRATDTLLVACESGELVSLQGADGTILRTVRLERDLRDIVLDGEGLFISRFRAAEVLRVGPDGTIVERFSLPSVGPATSSVAWRMVAGAEGGVVIAHQRALSLAQISTRPGGYSGECAEPIVQSVVSTIDSEGVIHSGLIGSPFVLPVDVAFDSASHQAVVVAAGTRRELPVLVPPTPGASIDLELLAVALPEEPPPPSFPDGRCFGSESVTLAVPFDVEEGQVVAIGIAPEGRVVQTRDPWAIVLQDGRSIELTATDMADSGHELFHLDSGGGLACASCHPGGRDDGVTWHFEESGARRTQNLRGGVLGTEPFHWSGDIPDFSALLEDVFTSRMGGPLLPPEYGNALATWIDTMPAPIAAPVSDPVAAARGAAIFRSIETRCVSCHVGERHQSARTVDVGTGGTFQVPSLIGVSGRTPLLHNGCASTVADRFGDCGGGDHHGHTSQLSEADLHDLVTYLESL